MPEPLISLEARYAAGTLPDAAFWALAAPRGQGLFCCEQCGNARPAFALYDTRDDDRFEHDWTCESDVAAIVRAELAAVEAALPPPPPLPPPPLTAEQLTALLIGKGLVTQADVDAAQGELPE